jgi:hypothetical protein
MTMKRWVQLLRELRAKHGADANWWRLHLT